jgi:HAD superfamily hydrolase (TIGR01509 family)
MPLDTRRIRAICFDVDGTLSDTDDLWVERFALALSPLRFVFPRRDPRSFARWAIMAAESPGNLLYSWLDWAHLDDDLGRLVSYMARRRVSAHPRQFRMVPGVRECLNALAPHYPMAVVSARDQAHNFGFMDAFDLRGMFECVATSQTCVHTKPFPDPVLWAAAQMGTDPREVLMVGDTTVDIHAGRSAGAQTVGVLCGFGSEAELRRAGADLILTSTADLPAVLLG